MPKPVLYHITANRKRLVFTSPPKYCIKFERTIFKILMEKEVII